MVLDSQEQGRARQVELPFGATRTQAPCSLPTVGLFSGVGGIELGLGRAGHDALILCEVDEPARAVLRRRFPDLSVHDDVCTLRELPGETKLIAGGFPCQDLS